MNAESAYLFRHALLRDAAYQLQLPRDRARGHRLAFEAIEALCGGGPPEAPSLGGPKAALEPHATDAHAKDLAKHAELAGMEPGPRRNYVRRAAEYAVRLHRMKEAQELWLQHGRLSSGVEEAESIRAAGHATVRAGQPGPAIEHFEQARARFRTLGERRHEGDALVDLGAARLDLGQVDDAAGLISQGLELAAGLGDEALAATLRALDARLHYETGRLQEAHGLFSRAIEGFRALNLRANEGAQLAGMGATLRALGRLEESRAAIERAIALDRESGNLRAEGLVLGNLANLLEQLGELEEAETAYRGARAIAHEVGDRRLDGSLAMNYAAFLGNRGRLDACVQLTEEALVIHCESGNRRSAGIALGHLAEMRRRAGRRDEALATMEEAIALDAEVHNAHFEGIHRCDRAMILLELGRAAEARPAWREGARVLAPLGPAVAEPETRRMREICDKLGVPPFDGEPA